MTERMKLWLAPHCGPETEDENAICDFCARTLKGCAEANTEYIEQESKQDCGGSGFWCKNCGRFWANDSCGERYNTDLECKDGTKLTINEENFLVCHCGHRLFKAENGESAQAGTCNSLRS